jgi:hypothetical protein
LDDTRPVFCGRRRLSARPLPHLCGHRVLFRLPSHSKKTFTSASQQQRLADSRCPLPPATTPQQRGRRSRSRQQAQASWLTAEHARLRLGKRKMWVRVGRQAQACCGRIALRQDQQSRAFAAHAGAGASLRKAYQKSIKNAFSKPSASEGNATSSAAEEAHSDGTEASTILRQEGRQAGRQAYMATSSSSPCALVFRNILLIPSPLAWLHAQKMLPSEWRRLLHSPPPPPTPPPPLHLPQLLQVHGVQARLAMRCKATSRSLLLRSPWWGWEELVAML